MRARGRPRAAPREVRRAAPADFRALLDELGAREELCVERDELRQSVFRDALGPKENRARVPLGLQELTRGGRPVTRSPSAAYTSKKLAECPERGAMKEVPMLIVGGGAAGTMLTLELARRGVEALTVDRLPKPAETSNAITVHARTLEILERIDKRLAERYLERGIHNKGYVLHFVDAAGRRSEVRPGIDFTTLDSRYPFILVNRQNETERYLREYASEQFGASIEWGTQCVDLTQDADGVTATLETDGKRRELRCRYLVGCDGINSRVRRTVAVEQEQSEYKGTMLQNLDAFLNGFPDVDDYVHYCAGTDHFIMIVKLPGGFYRMLLSDRGEAAGPDVTPEHGFMRLVDKHFDDVKLGKIVWHSKWQSFVRLAHTYRKDRVFL